MNKKYKIELEQETDGRWIAEIESLSEAMVYGDTREQAIMNVEVLALRILADRLASRYKPGWSVAESRFFARMSQFPPTFRSAPCWNDILA